MPAMLGGPSASSVTCPQCPAFPVAPVRRRPPVRLAPPTPVPSVRSTASRAPAAAPVHTSPNNPAWASFITRTGTGPERVAQSRPAARPGGRACTRPSGRRPRPGRRRHADARGGRAALVAAAAHQPPTVSPTRGPRIRPGVCPWRDREGCRRGNGGGLDVRPAEVDADRVAHALVRPPRRSSPPARALTWLRPRPPAATCRTGPGDSSPRPGRSAARSCSR
jgi:hypothetical protein